MGAEKKAKRQRKRRTRTDHRGVTIFKATLRSGTTIYKAKWIDPDTKKFREVSFEKLGITSEPARREWAIRKSEELFGRSQALVLGAPRHTGQTLHDAIEEYFATKGQQIKPSTRDSYRAGAAVFAAWAGRVGLRLADDLRAEHLTHFVDWLAVQKIKAPVRGGRRSDRAVVDRTIAPSAVNGRTRSLKAILNHLRRRGRLAHISTDDLKDRLRMLAEPKRRPKYLDPTSLKKLLQAAARHDEETFVMTRDERGSESRGQTAKHLPITEFIAFMLLTGCRLEEALELPWSAINLDAHDESGVAVGEIKLDAEIAKTASERLIDLAVSPALRRLLMNLKVKAGDARFVFGGEVPYTETIVNRTRRRLVSEFGAPDFTWSQTKGSKPSLRSTCASYLTNAPGIFRAAAAYRSAAQLGHSVTIAQKHYVGLVRGISPDAKSLEAAMGITTEMDDVVGRAASVKPRRSRTG